MMGSEYGRVTVKQTEEGVRRSYRDVGRER